MTGFGNLSSMIKVFHIKLLKFVVRLNLIGRLRISQLNRWKCNLHVEPFFLLSYGVCLFKKYSDGRW